MDLGLDGKRCVVLASTAGLGFAAAQALASEGARVAISGRDGDRLAAALARLEKCDQRVRGETWGEPLDVTDAGALVRHLEGVRERWGGVDVLVTNAGGPPPAVVLEVEDAGLDAAYELTLKSAVHAIQTVVPWMRAEGFGRIIGMTSLTVRHPSGSLVYSNMMRVGLTAYFKSLADEIARDGVLVNTVCTGMFATERLTELFEARAERSGRTVAEERDAAVATIPVGREGDPKEFGALVAFLASERCSFLNGVALPYDGGAGRFLL